VGSAVIEKNEALVFLSLITHIGIVMTTCPGAEVLCSVILVLALEQLLNTIAMI